MRTDLTGKVFNRWTVLEYSHNKGKVIYWLAKCECGKIKKITGGSLIHNRSRSCGCLHREITKALFTVHGAKSTPEYRTYSAMKRRCNNKHASNYSFYGAQGIRVCKEWADSFVQFLTDMGCKPSPSHTIDRIDGSKGYSKDNCRWATKKEQAINTKRNKIVKWKGCSIRVSELADLYSIPVIVLNNRLRRGWDLERAVLQPLRDWPKSKQALPSHPCYTSLS